MRVISKTRLKEFWQRPGRRESQGPLTAWHAHVSHKSVDWTNWSDVKAAFATASIVGNCVVFNVSGNKYRLVTRISFATHKLYVLKVMTHAEYDDDRWKADCGCYAPPPVRRTRPTS